MQRIRSPDKSVNQKMSLQVVRFPRGESPKVFLHSHSHHTGSSCYWETQELDTRILKHSGSGLELLTFQHTPTLRIFLVTLLHCQEWDSLGNGRKDRERLFLLYFMAYGWISCQIILRHQFPTLEVKATVPWSSLSLCCWKTLMVSAEVSLEEHSALTYIWNWFGQGGIKTE